MGPRAGLDRCGKSRPHGDFFYVTLLDLRGSYIRVQNVLGSYVRKRVLYTAPNVLAPSVGFGGDCGRV